MFQMKEWDNSNVIMTGNSDGVVRVSTSIYKIVVSSNVAEIIVKPSTPLGSFSRLVVRLLFGELQH